MKKIISLIFISMTLSCSLFAEKFLNWEIKAAAGLPVYGAADASRETLKAEDTYKRVAAGTEVDLSFNVSKPVKILIAAEAFCDFTFENSQYINALDYSADFGIKIYPFDDLGFNVTISYLLGCRTDFIKVAEIEDINNSDWGNGFKIDVNYDFLRNTKFKLMPTLGASYKYIPRGNNTTDHLFEAYAGVHF